MYDFVLNNFKPNNGRVEFYKGLLLVRLGENELGCDCQELPVIKIILEVILKLELQKFL